MEVLKYLKKKKYFSSTERLKYHEKRAYSDKVKQSQRDRSLHWLAGYNDSRLENNLVAAQRELESRKNDKSASNVRYCNNILKPYIRGMRARSESIKK